MENVRDHVNVRLITHWDGRYGMKAMIAEANFHSRSVFSENLITVEFAQTRGKIEQTDIRRYVRSRNIQDASI